MFDLSEFSIIAFLMLVLLEIVLGIDNIIFLSILVNKLPVEQQASARRFGLGLAMGTRILLLLSITWVMQLVEPLFNVFNHSVSGRDLILFGGGLFLLYKASHEIFEEVEEHGEEEQELKSGVTKNFLGTITQIAILDIVFSLDSVITAVGMVSHVMTMIMAVMASVGVMLFAAKPIGDFVEAHPSVKVLALSFLIMVGMTLVAESFGVHVPKGYVYASMAFALAVEALNIRMRKNKLKRA